MRSMVKFGIDTQIFIGHERALIKHKRKNAVKNIASEMRNRHFVLLDNK